MTPAVSGNGGGKYQRLCSRCFTEINPILIDSDEDTIPPPNRNSNTSSGLLLGSRKRKREFTSDDRIRSDNDVIEAERNEDEDDTANGPVCEKSHSAATLLTTPDVFQHEAEDDPQGMRWKSFSEVAEILKKLIRKSNLPGEGKSDILDLIAVLEKKPNLKPPKVEVAKSDRLHPKPGKEIEQLLRGHDKKGGELEMEGNSKEPAEEDRHPWIMSKKNSPGALSVEGGPPATAASKILMRVWDDRSQARIREGNEGFLSGCNYMPLDTKEQRKAAIENHANWKNRQKTAFISATTDIEDIAECLVPRLERRQERNGLLSITKITLINGNADGMPMLPIRKELGFYKCRIPYETTKSTLKKIERIEKCRREGKKMPKKMVRKSWYDTEYVFLFRIPAEQIVKTWLWKDVKQWLIDNKTNDIQRWYQEVLVPTYNRHEQNRISGSVESAHEPNCTCCGH
jgi:hypothetical protein